MASISMEQTKAALKKLVEQGLAPKFDGAMDVNKLRMVMEQAQLNMPQIPGVESVAREYGGIESEVCQTQDAATDYIILYIHGGGWTCGNARTSRSYASALAMASKHPVITISYRLAPEHKYPAGLDDCISWYKAITEEWTDSAIYLLGESAGAYYSLVTAMRCRDTGLKMPNGLLLYSPPIEVYGDLDRNFDGNKDFTIEADKISGMGEMFLDREYASEIYAQPYLDDFHDLPPVLVAWDESESLAVDANIVVEKIKQNGGVVDAYSYPDCFHAFATAGLGTEESRDVMEKSIAFMAGNV